jgi:hypothetical protein
LVQTPATFYPRVHDFYRDTSTTHFTTNVRTHVKLAVMNADGKIVRRVDLHTLGAGKHRWEWSGKRDNGAKVAPGKYRVQIIDALNDKIAGSSKVVVATGWKIKNDSRTREGWDFSSAATKGNCFIDDVFDSTAEELDCWGGRYAIVRWRFKIPASATHLDWDVQGKRAFDDKCCHGVIKKSGKRLDSTHYQVALKVTGWRAYDATYADVFYKYKARI